MVVPWLANSDRDLANLLVLDKTCNKILKRPVLKQALLVSQPERLSVKRAKIWEYFLELRYEVKDLYEFYKKESNENAELIANVEEVIVLDV